MTYIEEAVALCRNFNDDHKTRVNMREIIIPMLIARRKGLLAAVRQSLALDSSDNMKAAMSPLIEDCRKYRKAVFVAMRRLRATPAQEAKP